MIDVDVGRVESDGYVARKTTGLTRPSPVENATSGQSRQAAFSRLRAEVSPCRPAPGWVVMSERLRCGPSASTCHGRKRGLGTGVSAARCHADRAGGSRIHRTDDGRNCGPSTYRQSLAIQSMGKQARVTVRCTGSAIPPLPAPSARRSARENLLVVLTAHRDLLAGKTGFPGLNVIAQLLHERAAPAIFVDFVIRPAVDGDRFYPSNSCRAG